MLVVPLHCARAFWLDPNRIIVAANNKPNVGTPLLIECCLVFILFLFPENGDKEAQTRTSLNRALGRSSSGERRLIELRLTGEYAGDLAEARELAFQMLVELI